MVTYQGITTVEWNSSSESKVEAQSTEGCGRSTMSKVISVSGPHIRKKHMYMSTTRQTGLETSTRSDSFYCRWRDNYPVLLQRTAACPVISLHAETVEDPTSQPHNPCPLVFMFCIISSWSVGRTDNLASSQQKTAPRWRDFAEVIRSQMGWFWVNQMRDHPRRSWLNQMKAIGIFPEMTNSPVGFIEQWLWWRRTHCMELPAV